MKRDGRRFEERTMSDIKRRIEGINYWVKVLVAEAIEAGDTAPVGEFLLNNYTAAMEYGRTDLARYIGRTWPSVRNDYAKRRRVAA